MSLMKTRAEEIEILKFLQDNFDKHVTDIKIVSGGEMSQAFSFSSNNRNLIIRINTFQESFIKDKYAYETFASLKIPIPKVFKIGEVDKTRFYCVTEQAKGENMDNIEEKVREKLYPELMQILDEIHSVKITPGKYGWWEGAGIAKYDSWKSYVLGSKLQNNEKYYQATFLEKDFIDNMHVEMKKLAEFLPEERFLIHGDYGGNNVMSDGQKITGILDWGNSAYGDFLYDVAYQEFWTGGFKLANIYREHYKKIGWNIENYDGRIKCYIMHIGIGALEFWARAALEPNYKMTKKRILEYLKA